MNPDSSLARLAAACGIEAGYHDIWGNWHALSEDTARRLLGAMGIDVFDSRFRQGGIGQNILCRIAEIQDHKIPPEGLNIGYQVFLIEQVIQLRPVHAVVQVKPFNNQHGIMQPGSICIGLRNVQLSGGQPGREGENIKLVSKVLLA